MKKQRNFKLSDRVFAMLVDIAADDGTSYTEAIEILIIQEYQKRNQLDNDKNSSEKI